MQLLHLGYFDRVFPNWVNADITPHLFVGRVPGMPWLLYKDRVMSAERYRQHREGLFRQIKYVNATNRFPFRDSTFACAYTSHMLEDLKPEGAVRCVREVHRVLQPRGIFRIAVPDLDEVIRSYDPSQPDDFLEAFFESGQRLSKNRHHRHYNEHSLRQALLDAGFCEAVRQRYREGRCMDVALIDERPGSLFNEATK